MVGDGNKSKTSPKEKASVEAPTKATTPADAPVKVEAKTEPTAHSNYSRGEGQKPVSQAYKDNWNAIFAKKKKR